MHAIPKVVKLMCEREYDTASEDRCRNGEQGSVEIPGEGIMHNDCGEVAAPAFRACSLWIG